MKLDTKTNKLHTNGVLESSTFKVANSVHMMDILSNFVYQDKISAIIRELSTNAYDGHVKANNTECPFDVHLPTRDETYFSIRDYGSGLSVEEIKNIYTVYGFSDKSNSNEFVGCFGLGSKSPFCYTKMFTTTSYYNGMKYVFVNAINNDGRPTCNLLHKEETNEPNGLEVYLDVENKDIMSFRKKAEDIYIWFNVKPNANMALNYTTTYESMVNSNWLISKKGTYSENSYVVMGQVAYPVDINQFKGNSKNLLDHGVVINVELGEVDMTSSREGLQYNNKTIKCLEHHLFNIRTEIQEKFSEKINSCKFLWDATLKYREIKVENNRLFSVLDLKLIYDGREINDDYIQPSSKMILINKSMRSHKATSSYVDSISPSERAVFVISDTKDKGISRVKYHLDNTNYNNEYYIVDKETKEPEKFLTDTFGIDLSTVLYTSKIPYTTTKQAVKVLNELDVYKFYYLNRCNSIHSCRTKKTIDITDGDYIYITLSERKCLENNRTTTRQLKDVCSFFNTDIIILTKSKIKYISNLKNWIKLEDFLKTGLDTYFSNKTNYITQDVGEASFADKFYSLEKMIDKTTKFYISLSYAMSKTRNTNTKKDEAVSIINFYNSFGHKYQTPQTNSCFDNKVLDKYPMLKLIGQYQRLDKNQLDIAAKYINSIG